MLGSKTLAAKTLSCSKRAIVPITLMASTRLGHSLSSSSSSPSSYTLHPWNRLHPSLGEFASDPRNQVAIQAMPQDLQARVTQDPCPHKDYHTYQETLTATTSWLNDIVASHMKTATSEAAYTTDFLKLYDAMVWRFNSPFHWRIRQEEGQGLYNDCLLGSRAHCEVAVGSGLLLAELNTAPLQLERLLLVDLQEDALETCRQRLGAIDYYKQQQVTMESLRTSILDDWPSHGLSGPLESSFDTVACNFLMHCLPRGPDTIERAIANSARLLKPGGLYFGTSILGQELLDDKERAGPAAIQTQEMYNQVGVFGNDQHAFSDFSAPLHKWFESVEIWRIGYCVAWKARFPKTNR